MQKNGYYYPFDIKYATALSWTGKQHPLEVSFSHSKSFELAYEWMSSWRELIYEKLYLLENRTLVKLFKQFRCTEVTPEQFFLLSICPKGSLSFYTCSEHLD